MSEIFAMDGYGFYVWGSVLISLLVLIINWMTAHKSVSYTHLTLPTNREV